MGSELLVVDGLKKWFPFKTGFIKSKQAKAVDGISFDVKKGEIFGLVGESGCGKTTTGKVILRLIEKTAGSVFLKGEDVFALKRKQLRETRQMMQMIFQNPYEVLEARLTVSRLLSEPLEFHDLAGNEGENRDKITEALHNVDLEPPEEFVSKRPFELSGGQLQRIAIARALILQPEFIVADEPVSMLDVSIRAGVLKLLNRLRKELGLTYLFITHDLAISKFVCDRLAVMYLGKIVEMGPSVDLLDEPLHPYTRALRAATPSLNQEHGNHDILSNLIGGEIPSAMNIPQGCRFHPRCPYAAQLCKNGEPSLREFGKGRYVACHYAENLQSQS